MSDVVQQSLAKMRADLVRDMEDEIAAVVRRAQKMTPITGSEIWETRGQCVVESLELK